jgi:uncharacterized protein (DUF4415 family)
MTKARITRRAFFHCLTLRLGVDVIDYFKALSQETGIPYQTLINLYLRECAQTGKKPALSWTS